MKISHVNKIRRIWKVVLAFAMLLQIFISTYVFSTSIANIVEMTVMLGVLFIIFSCKSLSVFKYTFNHFLITIIFGGLGMLIGHLLDMKHIKSMEMMHQKMISLSISSSFFNWMTGAMLLFCAIGCLLTPDCKINIKGSPTKKSAVYLCNIIFMLLGMYIGRIISIHFYLHDIYRFYLTITLMGLFSSASYCLLDFHTLIKTNHY